MFGRIDTISIEGLEALNIDIQIHITSGLPCFIIVGLPDKTIAESKERVRAAITSLGIQFPQKRIVVNLSPADLFKEGTHYDLAIALGLISVINTKISDKIKNYIFMGELSLDGNIMPVSGVLPAAIMAKNCNKGIVCPKKNLNEALFSGNKKVVALESLSSLLNYFTNDENKIELIYESSNLIEEMLDEKLKTNNLDMQDVLGQKIAKRGLVIAAAGRHNILMQGPPGTGKTMLAKRLLSISPELNIDEIMMINMIASITKSFNSGINISRPFREPHHSCSMAAMVGGGKFAKPGEITLAHKGILFLDELPEFSKQIIDALRQPMESRVITVSRVNAKYTYPADFQLVAAMNPCRCGYFGDISRMCKKAPLCKEQYLSKISGPFLDRIDINIEVGRVDFNEFQNRQCSEKSSIIKEKVIIAHEIQKKRYKGIKIQYNSEADGDVIDNTFCIENEGRDMILNSIKNNKISLRMYKKVLRVARTIADLKESNNVSKNSIMEALYYWSSI